jgi:hypothetical protein
MVRLILIRGDGKDCNSTAFCLHAKRLFRISSSDAPQLSDRHASVGFRERHSPTAASTRNLDDEKRSQSLKNHDSIRHGAFQCRGH